MLAVLIIVCSGITLILDSEQTIKDRFTNECPSALVRLEKNYSEVKGVARFGHVGGGPREILGNPIHFAVSGPLQLFEFTSDVTPKKDSKTFRHVYCRAGSKSFSLQSVGNSPYYITDMGGGAIADATFRMIFGRYLEATWSIFGMRLVELIKAKDYRLIAARECAGTRIGFLEAEFEANSYEGKPISFRVCLDPANDWAIVESEVKLGPSLTEVSRIEYASVRDGVVRYPESIYLKGIEGREQYCKFDNIILGKVDPEKFRISNYGLKDVAGNQPDGSPHLSWWLVASGLIATLLIASVTLNLGRNEGRRRDSLCDVLSSSGMIRRAGTWNTSRIMIGVTQLVSGRVCAPGSRLVESVL